MKTLAELKRNSDMRYDHVDYSKDARTELFASLDQAVANGYENIKLDPPSSIAADVGEYDISFESVEPEEIVPWVEEWQKADKLTCDACGNNFVDEMAECSKTDMVVCRPCKRSEDAGAELTVSSCIQAIGDQLGAEFREQ